MKSVVTAVLAGLLSLTVASGVLGGVAAGVSENGAPAGTTTEKTEPAAKPVEKPVEKPAEPAKVEQPKKDSPAPEAKPAPTTPYEKKIAGAEKFVADAKAVLAKLPDMEVKVADAVSKMKDSAQKPVDVKKLQEELQGHAPSANARTYRDLTHQLIAVHAAAVGLLGKALAECTALAGMTAPNDAAKKQADTLTASVKEQCLAELTKMAGLYERVGERDNVTACYRQMMAIDRNNSAALAYFKELAQKEKERKAGGGGGYSQSGTGRGGY